MIELLRRGSWVRVPAGSPQEQFGEVPGKPGFARSGAMGVGPENQSPGAGEPQAAAHKNLNSGDGLPCAVIRSKTRRFACDLNRPSIPSARPGTLPRKIANVYTPGRPNNSILRMRHLFVFSSML